MGASVAYGRCGLGTEGIVPHSVGGSMWFLVYLFVCVRAGPIYRATHWRAVLATARRCVEGYRTPDEALAANLNLCRGRDSRVGWHSEDDHRFDGCFLSKNIKSV